MDYLPAAQLRWLSAKNASSNPIPGWSVVRCVGALASGGSLVLLVDKPSGGGVGGLFVCGAVPIKGNGYGIVTYDTPVVAAYDTSVAAPAAGAELGNKTDACVLRAQPRGGWVALADGANGRVLVRRADGAEPDLGYNAYGSTITKGSCVQVTGTQTSGGAVVYTINRPTTTLGRFYALALADIDSAKVGPILFSRAGASPDTSTSGLTAMGDCGPTPNSFALQADLPGFSYLGQGWFRSTPIVAVRGEVSSAIAKNTSGTLNVSKGSSTTSSGFSITAKNHYGDIEAGATAMAEWINSEWEFGAAECV